VESNAKGIERLQGNTKEQQTLKETNWAAISKRWSIEVLLGAMKGWRSIP
jgi:hypothetical protein